MEADMLYYSAKKILPAALIFLVTFASRGFSSEKEGRGIIEKMRKAFYYAGSAMNADVSMALVSKSGKKQKRKLTMLRLNTEKVSQKLFLYFHEPQDVRGTAFLVWKYPVKDDDRWLFIPALNMVRRVAAQDSQSSFVGSDFTYEDISGRDVDMDTHKFIKEIEDFDGKKGQNVFVVESMPKGKAEYKKKNSYVDEKTYLPLKEEYMDAQGKVYKVFSAEEIKIVDGVPTITKRVMENVKTGHKTEVEFTEVSYPQDLPEELFTEKSLKKPPSKWVK